MSLEREDGSFAWNNLKSMIAAMWRHPLTRANGIVVLNNAYFGRGTWVDWAMSLIQQAEDGNNVALLDIKGIRHAADQGEVTKKDQLELLRVTRAAKQMAFQQEVNELALRPIEPSKPTSPYEMLTT